MTGAERQRRYYRHHKGDHSLCDPARRCEAVEAVTLAEAAADPEPGRGERARALWDDLAEQVAHDVMARLQLEEACRVLDRLDLLRGAADVASMTEARQQTSTLRSLFADIRKAVGKATPAKAPEPLADETLTDDEQEGEVEDFATALARRRSKATG